MKKAVVSSTVLDLPDHRREVRDACLRQSIFPLMMEHLPALDEDAIRASMTLVDEADVYLGVFGHRYGHRPVGHDISITEMEFRRAKERNIPCYLFVMSDAHLVKRDDVECGEGEKRLVALKKDFGSVVAHFDSPVDLRAHVIDTLARWRIGEIENG